MVIALLFCLQGCHPVFLTAFIDFKFDHFQVKYQSHL